MIGGKLSLLDQYTYQCTEPGRTLPQTEKATLQVAVGSFRLLPIGMIALADVAFAAKLLQLAPSSDRLGRVGTAAFCSTPFLQYRYRGDQHTSSGDVNAHRFEIGKKQVTAEN